MRLVQIAAHVPNDLCLTSLREIMALNEVQVHTCHQEPQQQPPPSPEQHRQPPAQPPVQRRSRAAAAAVRLTAMEREVLLAFTYCDTNDEIADLLGVAESTVKTHVKNLFRKLRVKSRAFAIGRALRLGLLSAQELVTTVEATGMNENRQQSTNGALASQLTGKYPPQGGAISPAWGMGGKGKPPV